MSSVPLFVMLIALGCGDKDDGDDDDDDGGIGDGGSGDGGIGDGGGGGDGGTGDGGEGGDGGTGDGGDGGDGGTGDGGDGGTGDGGDGGTGDGGGSDTGDGGDGGTGDGGDEECPTPVDACEAGACMLDLDLDVVGVSGTATYDGGPIRNYGESDFDVTFVESSTGTTIAQNFGGTGAYAMDLPPGTYDVWLQVYDEDGVNEQWRIEEDLAITGSTTLDLDLDVVGVSGTATYDGGPIRNYGESDFDVTFVEFSTGTTIAQNFGGTGAYAMDLPPGIYDVWLQVYDEGGVNEQWLVHTCIAIGP